MSDVIPAAPALWCAVGASVTGAAHSRAGKPKQDALGWQPAQGHSVALAVADGHGSPKCFRSERGSQFAVDVALALLSGLMAGAVSVPLERLHGQVKETLPQQIIAQWRQAVEADLAREPITEEEWATLAARDGEAATQPVRADPLLAYGTTLLAAAATPRFLLVLQNGDGDILSVSREGVVARPLPGDSRLMANETTSLCSPDAARNFRSAFHEMTGTPPALLILSTDGYANSFQDEAGFLQVGTDLLALISAHGLGQVTANLKDWLEHASTEGSGDDVTLGLLALQSGEAAPPPARAATPSRLPAAVGGGEGPSLLPAPAASVAPPEPVIRPATTAVSLPQASSMPLPRSSMPLPPPPMSHAAALPPSPQSAPTPGASPTRSVLGALGVLALGVLLLFLALVIGKHHPRAGQGRAGQGTSGGQTTVHQPYSLGTVHVGATVPLPIPLSIPGPLHFRIHPAHQGLSLRLQGHTLLLVISRGRKLGALDAEVHYWGSDDKHRLFRFVGTVAAPQGGASSPESAPQDSPETAAPPDTRSPGGKAVVTPTDKP